MKNIMTATYVKDDKDFMFNFYTDLSAYDKMVFVNSVVDTIVDDTSYDSIIRDLIFDFNIITMFTDINIPFINENNDEDSVNLIILIEEFLESNNAIEIIKANMKDGLISELNNAIDKSIEYRTGIHVNPLNDALASLANTIERKIEEIDSSSIIEIADILSKMTGEITPESIVDAYIKSNEKQL